MDLIIWFDQYVDWIETFIRAQVVVAPLLLLFLEETGIPIIVPGDAILAYTGLHVSRSSGASLWFAFVVALLSVIAGSSILFFVSRRYGQKVVDKIGRFIFLEESRIKQAEKLFKRFGVWTIILGRHIPGMRIPITIFAAISGIKYRTFIISTIISTVLWILFYLHIGKRYGGDIQTTIHKYSGFSLAILVTMAVLLIALHLRGAHKQKKATKK